MKKASILYVLGVLSLIFENLELNATTQHWSVMLYTVRIIVATIAGNMVKAIAKEQGVLKHLGLINISFELISSSVFHKYLKNGIDLETKD